MAKSFFTAFLIALLLPSVASACSWARTTLKNLNNSSASMVTSENNKFLLKMLPSQWGQKGDNYFKVRHSIGTIYNLDQNGDFQYQWNAKEIHPREVKGYRGSNEYFTVLLSNDGKRVAKVKQFYKGLRDSKETPKDKDFIAIYEQGKISHRFSYFDVFKKLPSPMQWTCLGGYWVSDIKLEGNVLSLKSGSSSTKNSKQWSVDITSGKTAK